jgi:hypothetical protein
MVDQPAYDECTWGSAEAPARVVLAGDSIAMTDLGPLRELALSSNGQLQVHSEAMFGCEFVTQQIANDDQSLVDACPARKQHTIDVINSTHPTAVIIVNNSAGKRFAGTQDRMSPQQWKESMRQIVEKFQSSTTKVVFLSSPDAGVVISDCYGVVSNTPPDCVSKMQNQWKGIANAEQDLATSIPGARWIDSRPWFCDERGRCPSFVGSIPTKMDPVHMTPAYGQKITPVIGETLRVAGVF